MRYAPPVTADRITEPVAVGKVLKGVAGSPGVVSGTARVLLSLPFDKRHSPALDSVIDGVRARFGNDAVERAVLLGRHTGISVPLLPD